MTRQDEAILKSIVKQEGNCIKHRWGCWECPLDNVCVTVDNDCAYVVVKSDILERRLELACKMLADFEIEKLLKGKR